MLTLDFLTCRYFSHVTCWLCNWLNHIFQSLSVTKKNGRPHFQMYGFFNLCMLIWILPSGFIQYTRDTPYTSRGIGL